MILFKLRDWIRPWAPLSLRFGLGLVFLLFAAQKLGNPGQGNAEIQLILSIDPSNRSLPALLNYGLGVTELMVAFSFLSGAFIRYTALIATALIMLFFGGLVTKYGLRQDPTLNRDLGLIGGAFALWLLGAGPLSVDEWLEKKNSKSQNI